jgi:hypothetical protein
MSSPVPSVSDLSGASVPNADGSGNAGGSVPVPSTAPVPAEEAKFTQADVDRLITARLAREREQAEAKATRAREQQAADTLVAQGQFQALAEQHARRAEQLEAELSQQNAFVDRYADSLRKINRARIKDWSDEAKALIPRGDDVDPVEQAEAIERAAALVERLRALEGSPGGGPPGSAAGRIRPPGNPPSPRAVGPAPDDAALADEKARLRARGTYLP